MERTLSRVLIGNYSELPERLGKTVIIGDKEIAVFKLANGKIRAIENRCPHKGGVLAEGMVSGEHIFCPMHNWKINVNNGQAQAPDEGCVGTYQVEVKNNSVYVLV
ncbi:nitrite reductase (NADH) small subunit [Halobacillus karajensis]|uniref:Assimilatory nitrite reductase [NAD(P)H] small subunit n=1 Tax=Halobacillus karajensis TaxID=195088 RepID=A0A024P571_9BACI|nr:nitrite reductase small subunit NirD [Halobacillus karajensis]CDQ20739.1 Assimilatory nitrite reductase [NAD(P)H] small subunit [Halobacillus karajensis]CDQ23791.1 Assimilatory nitrite reductase [NAD(P)H] small subunit [Halobacillus karajensis]CDQ27269.1 Assimilatory nitrite reductase [NAD(P)H] small subunit [Halobacillus karajensis]SEI05118.1 nitrite reductase (NADH) small subunit [Halobacillus karajensis]